MGTTGPGAEGRSERVGLDSEDRWRRAKRRLGPKVYRKVRHLSPLPIIDAFSKQKQIPRTQEEH